MNNEQKKLRYGSSFINDRDIQSFSLSSPPTRGEELFVMDL
jgi:hypothetical protein